MSDKVFVDFNILLYAHDNSSGPRHDQAKNVVRRLWQHRTGVLSTQILQEVYVNLRKKGARSLGHAEARTLIEDYLRWDVVVNTAESVVEATRIEERFQLSLWDALVPGRSDGRGFDVVLGGSECRTGLRWSKGVESARGTEAMTMLPG